MLMLDDIVFSSALAQARRLVKQGYDAEAAADYACHGAWNVYRKRVMETLLAEQTGDGREDSKPRSR
jgi:hypothetical protein